MQNFLEDYLKMCDEGKEIGDGFQAPSISGVSNILMCGLGGSGVCGDLVVDVAKLRIPVIVVKDYHIPKFADDKSLVFCVSYSGNTEETLKQFSQANERGCNIISVTSGGVLEKWSRSLDIPVIKIPSGRNPRDALPLMLLPILKALQKMGFGSYDRGIEEAKEAMNMINTNKLDELATKIKNSRLAIYGTSDHYGSLRRIKNEFNENAKMIIIYDFFPELNHNEMNGYQRTGLTKNVDVLFMRDEKEIEEMRNRIEITKGILEHYVHSINEIWAVGESKLARTMSFAFMGAYITWKIADMTGINRSDVPFVDRLKGAMKDKVDTVGKLESKMSGN